jgi:hypothetical protein
MDYLMGHHSHMTGNTVNVLDMFLCWEHCN